MTNIIKSHGKGKGKNVARQQIQQELNDFEYYYCDYEYYWEMLDDEEYEALCWEWEVELDSGIE